MQALLSVSDKTGLVNFARGLSHLGVSLLSTGGTAKLLQQAALQVTEVADYTGFPELLDGRVKTLHPRIHAGILAKRDNPAHQSALINAGIPTIDLVVVNLYPFQQTVTKAGVTLEEAIENIDIGGPTMLRAAAKNFAHVGVIADPADYPSILRELEKNGGLLSDETRFQLAQKAFSHSAAYDGAISNYLTAHCLTLPSKVFPERFNLQVAKIQDLRYGENPHQQAAFYRDIDTVPGALAQYRQIQGKELSYNNIADADAAWECVKTFAESACVIIKHANPCGVALGETTLMAYRKAWQTDPTSAFGGIIAFNREVDKATAEAVCQQFVEVVIAPTYTPDALQVIAKKTNVRVLEVPLERGANRWDMQRIGGGLLLQTTDTHHILASELKVVTNKAPSAQQIDDLLFAWRVAKFVKSNAIVFARDGQTLAIGAGQMSRIDSARIAAIKAENAKLGLRDSVVASDAFFPFRDGLDTVVDAGAIAVIQPGGSQRDQEVIAAADQRSVAMVFTGVRHFRH